MAARPKQDEKMVGFFETPDYMREGMFDSVFKKGNFGHVVHAAPLFNTPASTEFERGLCETASKDEQKVYCLMGGLDRIEDEERDLSGHCGGSFTMGEENLDPAWHPIVANSIIQIQHGSVGARGLYSRYVGD